MKIILLGDSFTRGFGVKPSETWSSLLRMDNIQFVNKGINGDTTTGMLSRFYRDVIAEKPHLVLITGGINDFISGSSVEIPQNNYMAMVHQAASYGITPVIGISHSFSPSSVRDDWAAFADFTIVQKKQKALRLWLLSLCKTFDLQYIDFYREFEAVKNSIPCDELYVDGLHLTSQGHKYIADIASNFFKAII